MGKELFLGVIQNSRGTGTSQNYLLKKCAEMLRKRGAFFTENPPFWRTKGLRVGSKEKPPLEKKKCPGKTVEGTAL